MSVFELWSVGAERVRISCRFFRGFLLRKWNRKGEKIGKDPEEIGSAFFCGAVNEERK